MLGPFLGKEGPEEATVMQTRIVIETGIRRKAGDSKFRNQNSFSEVANHRHQQVLCFVGVLEGVNVSQSFATRPILTRQKSQSKSTHHFQRILCEPTVSCAGKMQC